MELAEAIAFCYLDLDCPSVAWTWFRCRFLLRLALPFRGAHLVDVQHVDVPFSQTKNPFDLGYFAAARGARTRDGFDNGAITSY